MNRNTGSHARDRVALLEAEQPRADAVLEDQHQEAVGRADGQQVHDDRLRRDDERAEHHHQQEEAQAEHEDHDDRDVRRHRVDVVARAGGVAADDDLGVRALERRPDDVRSQVADLVRRRAAARVAGDDDGQRRDLPSLLTCSSPTSVTAASRFNAERSFVIAACTPADCTSPWMTICVGAMRPAEKSRSRILNACTDGRFDGIWSTLGLPSCIVTSGAAAATSSATDATIETTGCRMHERRRPPEEAALAFV